MVKVEAYSDHHYNCLKIAFFPRWREISLAQERFLYAGGGVIATIMFSSLSSTKNEGIGSLNQKNHKLLALNVLEHANSTMKHS